MKLIKPSVEYIPQTDLYKHIELCSRVCYKSEDRITEGSAQKFVERLANSNHLAMLEHGTTYAKCGPEQYKEIRDGNLDSDSDFWTVAHSPYSELFYHDHCNYLTTNYRVLFDLAAQDTEFSFNDFIANFQCEPTVHHTKRYTIKFVTDIGVCRELLRHRKFSFANESTRYCNYSKGKFGGELTFITPTWYTGGNGTNDKECSMDSEFELSCEEAEKSYLRMISWGATPQEARQVLPLATKTELVMTGFKEDWDHFFSLRYYGTTGKPHPDMQYIAKLAFDELESKSDYRCPRDNFYEGVTGTSFNKD